MIYRSVCIKGIELVLDSSFSSKMKIRLIRGKYELPEFELISKNISGSERVIEMGAGIGFVSLLLASKLHSGKLFSYEVNPGLLKIIEKNKRLNKSNFTLLNKFLTNDKAIINSSLPFYISNQFYSSSFEKFDGYKKKIEVQAESLDNEIQSKKITTLVIDIEGYEYKLFFDWEIPKEITKIFLEIHPYKVSESYDFSLLLENAGFSVDSSLLQSNVIYAFR